MTKPLTDEPSATRQEHASRIRAEIDDCSAALRKHNLSLAKRYPELTKQDIDRELEKAAAIVQRRGVLRSSLSRLTKK